ncbi:ABC transporter permease [Antribacter gilvus]|uniref:ABC transporter permease n=1 Tax=Antribacter gilvus TaxID=2304675 RepID=UPI000F7ADE8B|nr:ABC transporter permease [Antribacter gilvus]
MARARSRLDRRGRRTFLAVAVATYGLLLCFAAINAMSTVMTTSARDVISGDVSAFAPGYDYSMLSPQSDAVRFVVDSDEVAADLAGLPDVEEVRTRLNVAARVESGTQQAGVLVVAARFGHEGYAALDGEPPSRPGDVCVTETLVDELDVAVGDTVRLSLAGAAADSLEVTGRVSCVYDSTRFGLFRTSQVVMDLDDVRDILDRSDAATQLLVTLSDGTDPDDAAAALAAHTGDDVRFETAAQTADLIYVIQSAQRAVMWILVVVTALVSAVLTGNIVAFAVRRERHELAALRAMGFGPRALRTVSMLQTLGRGLGMVGAGTAAALVTVVVTALVGIPVGDGAQLFGDSRLVPSLSVVDVGLTALLMVTALVVADGLASSAMLRRTPLEMLRER